MLTISLPTKATSRSRPRVQPLERGRRHARVAGEGARRPPAAAAPLGPVQAGRQRAQPAAAAVGLRGAKRATSTPGRAEPGPLRELRIPERLPQARGGVPRADEHTTAPRHPLARELEEAFGFGLHRVLQGAPVNLDGIGDPAGETAGEDHRAHHQVVGEGHLRARQLEQLGDRGDVRLDVVGDLRVAAAGERARFDALVAVGHVHGQQATELGAVDDARARPRLGRPPRGKLAHPQRPPSQSPAADTNP